MQDQVNRPRLANQTTSSDVTQPPANDPVEVMRRRVGRLDPIQVKIWRQMTPVQRAAVVFKADRFAVGTIRISERRRHPALSAEELAWRVTRRMQGNPRLGRVSYEPSTRP